jgi:hypothetical protein
MPAPKVAVSIYMVESGPPFFFLHSAYADHWEVSKGASGRSFGMVLVSPRSIVLDCGAIAGLPVLTEMELQTTGDQVARDCEHQGS